MRRKFKNLIVTMLLISLVPFSINAFDNEKSSEKNEILLENKESDLNEELEDLISDSSLNNDVNTVDMENIYLNTVSVVDIVEVGKYAEFNIFISVSGSNKVYKNNQVRVTLPENIDNESIKFDMDMKDLKINNVEPIYDEVSNSLLYTFDEITGGFESMINLRIKTENGYNNNQVDLTLITEISLDSSRIIKVSSDTVTLSASKSVALSNKLLGIYKDGKLVERKSIRRGDEIEFGIGMSVNKLKNGSLDIDKEENIQLTYTFPEYFEYVSDSSNVTPIIDGNKYTWIVSPLDYENEEYFFNKNFNVKFIVSENSPSYVTLQTNLSTDIKYVDGETEHYVAEASVYVSENKNEFTPPTVNGSGISSVFSGPLDGRGNVGWLNNENPEVYSGDTLGWRFYLTSLFLTSPNLDITTYDFFFHPDENIIVEELYSGDFFFRPDINHSLSELNEEINYSLKIKYIDEDLWYEGLDKIVPSTTYSSEELKIDRDKTIETLWFHFYGPNQDEFSNTIGSNASGYNIPAGLVSTNTKINTSIKDGYTGPISSDFGISVSGWDARGLWFAQESDHIPNSILNLTKNKMTSAWQKNFGTKTAQVVEPPEGPSRFVRSNISLEKAKNDVILETEDNLIVSIINDAASVDKLRGPFVSYLLISEGIEIDKMELISGGDVKIIDTNFNNEGKTLLKLVYKQNEILTGNGYSIVIPVKISESSPYKIDAEVFGFLNESFSVSSVSNVNGSVTQKIKDTFDLNQDGNTGEDIYYVKNSFLNHQPYEYSISMTTEDGSIVVDNIGDEPITSKINVTSRKNNPIKDLDIIGVLPSHNDSFVLSDIDRDSEFELVLNDLIKIPEKYEDYFTVYYSESKDPLVNGVIDKNVGINNKKLNEIKIIDDKPWVREKDVLDFSKIKSFRIVKNNDKLIYDNEIEFYISTKVSNDSKEAKPIIDKRAFFTSAVAVNDSSVLETKGLTFVQKQKSTYSLKGNNVKIGISKLTKLQELSELEHYLKLQIDATLLINEKIVDNFDYEVVKQDDDTLSKVGNHELLLIYKDDASGEVLAQTVINLEVFDDVENITPPNNDKKGPDTGIKSESTVFVIIGSFAVIILIGLLIGYRNKSKNSRKN